MAGLSKRRMSCHRVEQTFLAPSLSCAYRPSSNLTKRVHKTARLSPISSLALSISSLTQAGAGRIAHQEVAGLVNHQLPLPS